MHLLCAVILCLPAVCTGATLPILCRFYVDRMAKVGDEVLITYIEALAVVVEKAVKK